METERRARGMRIGRAMMLSIVQEVATLHLRRSPPVHPSVSAPPACFMWHVVTMRPADQVDEDTELMNPVSIER